jgi:hypothetical protein
MIECQDQYEKSIYTRSPPAMALHHRDMGRQDDSADPWAETPRRSKSICIWIVANAVPGNVKVTGRGMGLE